MLKKLLFVAAFIVTLSCQNSNIDDSETAETFSNWAKVEEKGSGTTVNFMMWQGSPVINNYINNYVKPELQKRYSIDLQVSGGQGPQIVKLVMGEKQAGVEKGQIDMAWINGETFFQLRQIDGLWGPFVNRLPNSKYINFEDPFINTDFQQPVNFMEAPWGISQFALVYDTTEVQNPPASLPELESFVKNHPGTFTISNDFSGMTLLKSLLAELGGSPTSLNGDFDEDKYERLSQELWRWVSRNKRYFWKEGNTFPKEHSKMDQMFASGELLITYGFNEGSFEDKVRQGLFPKSTRAYAWDNGTIKNSNYLGVLKNASNKAGAMLVINFLLSPEAQLKRMDPNGMDRHPVLDVSKLPQKWQQRFNQAEKRMYAPQPGELDDKAIQEPAPEYMIRLYEDFRNEVIEK